MPNLQLFTAKVISIGLVVLILFIAIFIQYKHNQFLEDKLTKTNQELAIVKNHSDEQKVKTVEVEKKVKEIQYQTKEKIKYVTTFTYDNNKSDCANGMALLRSQF